MEEQKLNELEEAGISSFTTLAAASKHLALLYNRDATSLVRGPNAHSKKKDLGVKFGAPGPQDSRFHEMSNGRRIFDPLEVEAYADTSVL